MGEVQWREPGVGWAKSWSVVQGCGVRARSTAEVQKQGPG